MNRQYRMRRLASLARNREIVAAQSMATSQREVVACKTQIAEMNGYREEYRAALSRDGNRLNALEVRKTHDFISQVDSVIDSLESKLKQTESRFESDRSRWVEHLKRSKSLSRLEERTRLSDQAAADAREQRDIDDRSQRTATKR